ncbi:hypothetical protein WHR41_07281 [Cladosporium halotolerans]|uniref:Uncharacterized protein n=1 Tax=Cladosporium halotolerans TaxID=1052096 RepID=A0AB34KHD6_9PEZI
MTGITYIFKKIRVGTVVKDGKEIVLSVATKTQAWTRTEVAKGQGWGFRAAVEKTLDQVASDTREICSRDSVHPSTDPRQYYSALELKKVAPDDDIPKDGKITHFLVKDTQTKKKKKKKKKKK